jgi:hypothetical protein
MFLIKACPMKALFGPRKRSWKNLRIDIAP